MFLPVLNIKALSANQLENTGPQPVTAQGGGIGFIPAIHFATPINDYLGLVLVLLHSIWVEDRLWKSLDLRYISTGSSVNVIDISPSFALKVSVSVGIGPDVQLMKGGI